MNKNEIKSQLEAEKQQLAAFLKLAKKFELPAGEIEKQVNFYLDKIAELKRKLET